jgi:nucleoside phosphorylase
MSKKILIVTANDNETNAFLKGKGLKILKEDLLGKDNKDTNNYRKCKYYDYDVVQFQLNSQGSVKSDASLMSINFAINEHSPCAVILLGIAFGRHEEEHKIGDVVVSERMLDYESGKVKGSGFRSDNSVPDAGRLLLSACKNIKSKWNHKVGTKKAKVLFGTIVSGDKVVDDQKFRDALPTGNYYVLGGEMEARGLYSACRVNGISEWIVIKSICDWGHGKDEDKEKNQRYAANSATSFIDTLFLNEQLKRLTEESSDLVADDSAKNNTKKKNDKAVVPNDARAKAESIIEAHLNDRIDSISDRVNKSDNDKNDTSSTNTRIANFKLKKEKIDEIRKAQSELENTIRSVQMFIEEKTNTTQSYNLNKGKDLTETIAGISVEKFINENQNKYLDAFYSEFSNEDKRKIAEELVGFFLQEGKDSSESADLYGIYNAMVEYANSKSGSRIVINGLQGTGKSTLIALLYKKLMDNYKETHIFPLIIDLHSNPKVSNSVLKKDLQAIKNISKSNKFKFVFFIDGIDEKQFESKRAIENELVNFINTHKKMTIVFCATQVVKDDESYRNGKKSALCNSYTSAVCTYGMHRVPIRDSVILDSVVTKLDSYLAPDEKSNKAKDAISLLKKYALRKVDFRTLLIVLKADHLNDKDLGQILYEHYSNPIKGNKEEIMSEIAYATAALVKEESHSDTDSRVIKKYSNVIRKNSITRSFFIAVHLCNLLKTSNEKAFIEQIESQPVLNAITNDLFDNLYKSLMGKVDREKINNTLRKIIEKEDNHPLVVAQAAHMLARINSYGFAFAKEKEVQETLLIRWNTLHKKYFENDILVINDPEMYNTIFNELILFRTLSVSLLINGYRNHERQFLDCILQNDLFNSINRGFHIAYFDEQFADKDNNRYLDDTRNSPLRVDSTMAFLIQSIYEEMDRHLPHHNRYAEDCINPLLSLNILTVLTICQSRSETGIMDKYETEISNILKHIVLGWIPVVESVKQYAKDFFLDDSNNFDKQKCDRLYYEVLADIFNLKMERMKGWNANGNEVDLDVVGSYEAPLIRSESVNDHIYGSFILGRLFLPNSLYNWTHDKKLIEDYSSSGYDKESILRMLLIHDFGKCKTGDQIHKDQTVDYNKKQDDAVLHYKYTRSARGIYGFDTWCSDWTEYYNGRSLNSMIAKDINSIEMYITANMYKGCGKKINMKNWSHYIDYELQTEMGKSILIWVRRGLLDF